MNYEDIFQQAKQYGLEEVRLWEGGSVLFESSPDPEKRRPVHSIAKSILSMAAGIAIDEGKLGLEETVNTALGAFHLADENAAMLPEKCNLEHLLTMTLGQEHAFLSRKDRDELRNYGEKNWILNCLKIPFVCDPGSQFLYSDACAYLFGKIFQRKVGMSITEYLMPRLFEPLDIRRLVKWECDPEGDVICNSGLELSLEEIHRLSLLCLQNGMFQGRQLISQDWIQKAQSPIVKLKAGFGYGYYFWTGRNYSYMYGAGGQYSFMIPSRNTVLTVLADVPDSKKLFIYLDEFIRKYTR